MAVETSGDTVTYTGSAGTRQEAVGVVVLAGGGGGGGGGGGTPTGSAGSPNAAVVTVQGISGGTPQSVTVTNPTAQGLTDAQLRATPVPVSVTDGSDQAFGSRSDAAATSDTGSFSFIAFVKRLLGYQSTLATAALKPTAGTNLSGTVTTTSGGFNLTADPNRKPGDVQGQNNGTVAIAFNEFNGTAAINTAGSYTVPPGSQFVITTNRQVNFIAASGTAPVTITGL